MKRRKEKENSGLHPSRRKISLTMCRLLIPVHSLGKLSFYYGSYFWKFLRLAILRHPGYEAVTVFRSKTQLRIPNSCVGHPFHRNFGRLVLGRSVGKPYESSAMKVTEVPPYGNDENRNEGQGRGITTTIIEHTRYMMKLHNSTWRKAEKKINI